MQQYIQPARVFVEKNDKKNTDRQEQKYIPSKAYVSSVDQHGGGGGGGEIFRVMSTKSFVIHRYDTCIAEDFSGGSYPATSSTNQCSTSSSLAPSGRGQAFCPPGAPAPPADPPETRQHNHRRLSRSVRRKSADEIFRTASITAHPPRGETVSQALLRPRGCDARFMPNQMWGVVPNRIHEMPNQISASLPLLPTAPCCARPLHTRWPPLQRNDIESTEFATTTKRTCDAFFVSRGR